MKLKNEKEPATVTRGSQVNNASYSPSLLNWQLKNAQIAERELFRELNNAAEPQP